MTFLDSCSQTESFVLLVQRLLIVTPMFLLSHKAKIIFSLSPFPSSRLEMQLSVSHVFPAIVQPFELDASRNTTNMTGISSKPHSLQIFPCKIPFAHVVFLPKNCFWFCDPPKVRTWIQNSFLSSGRPFLIARVLCLLTPPCMWQLALLLNPHSVPLSPQEEGLFQTPAAIT